jgi:hypothetical protein
MTFMALLCVEANAFSIDTRWHILLGIVWCIRLYTIIPYVWLYAPDQLAFRQKS